MKHEAMPASATELMAMHAKFNMGGYFDYRIDADDVVYLGSEHIPDFYWNYGYLRNSGGQWSSTHLTEVRELATARDRQPAIWALGEFQARKWTLASEETWMAFDLGGIQARKVQDTEHEIDFEIAPSPTTQMVDVFRDGYSSGTDPNTPGYFDLPEEYADAFRSIQPPADVAVRHILLRNNQTPVCVGSVYTSGGLAGVYSVATAHEHRRRGYATALSLKCLQIALEMGAKHCMLQTEADSPVETMYQSIGFRRMFVGRLFVLDSSST